MAEINEAYAAIARRGRDAPSRRGRAAASASVRSGRDAAPAAAVRRAPRPTRPVTGRVDTIGNRPAAERADSGGRDRPGRPPVRRPASRRCAGRPQDREPPRASDPTGPLERGRDPRLPPAAPAAARGRRRPSSSSSASSAATRSARSPRSSRRTSTGWRTRSPATRSSLPRPASSRRTSTPRGVPRADPRLDSRHDCLAPRPDGLAAQGRPGHGDRPPETREATDEIAGEIRDKPRRDATRACWPMIRGYSARDLGPRSAAPEPSSVAAGRPSIRDRRPR